MKKQCRKCLKTKEIDDFYIHKKMADAHLNICKECIKERVRNYYISDIEKNRIKEHERYQRRRKDRHFVIKRNEYQKKWRTKEKRKAHETTHRKLKRPNSCELCGKICYPDGHHESYTEPLKVIWLCVPCHSRITRHKVIPF